MFIFENQFEWISSSFPSTSRAACKAPSAFPAMRRAVNSLLNRWHSWIRTISARCGKSSRLCKWFQICSTTSRVCSSIDGNSRLKLSITTVGNGNFFARLYVAMGKQNLDFARVVLRRTGVRIAVVIESRHSKTQWLLCRVRSQWDSDIGFCSNGSPMRGRSLIAGWSNRRNASTMIRDFAGIKRFAIIPRSRSFNRFDFPIDIFFATSQTTPILVSLTPDALFPVETLTFVGTVGSTMTSAANFAVPAGRNFRQIAQWRSPFSKNRFFKTFMAATAFPFSSKRVTSRYNWRHSCIISRICSLRQKQSSLQKMPYGFSKSRRWISPLISLSMLLNFGNP